MMYGRGPLLLQKYIIAQKMIKTTIVTLKVRDMNRERFNMSR